jgi:hypothetical protein
MSTAGTQQKCHSFLKRKPITIMKIIMAIQVKIIMMVIEKRIIENKTATNRIRIRAASRIRIKSLIQEGYIAIIKL